MESFAANMINDLSGIFPEIGLALSFLIVIVLSMCQTPPKLVKIFTIAVFAFSLTCKILAAGTSSPPLFGGMIQPDYVSWYTCTLIDFAALCTLLMTSATIKRSGEYYALLISTVLGAHFLSMTTHALTIFISIEMIGLGSYALAGFAFSKTGAEGSLKYFVFGATASACMLYGLSWIYGLSGTLDFSSSQFAQMLTANESGMLTISLLLVLAGFLYKIAAAPMHFWVPDVYQASPLPVLAFFSIVPKLAGFALLIKFLFSLQHSASSVLDGQKVVAVLSILTICIGNFAALYQTSVKRLMAYSSIAQSGFLMIALVSLNVYAVNSFFFYATAFLLANYAAFFVLQFFEDLGMTTIAGFNGAGRQWILPSVLLLVSLVSLTGLPPTGGFTGKLFIFSSLWTAYQETGKTLLLVLFVTGLLNTVVALFYYLRIPLNAYLKGGVNQSTRNILSFQNFFALVLVLAVLAMFFLPEVLMGWINSANFVN